MPSEIWVFPHSTPASRRRPGHSSYSPPRCGPVLRRILDIAASDKELPVTVVWTDAPLPTRSKTLPASHWTWREVWSVVYPDEPSAEPSTAPGDGSPDR